MKEIDFVQHDLHDNDWIGVVINNDDPTFSGRCQIKVFGLTEYIEDQYQLWATPINSTVFSANGAGSISIPKKGTIVKVQFNNGDLYAPEYTTIQNIDKTLIDKIKDDYDGTHVLLYDADEELNVMFQRKLGFQIYYKDSFINISPDSMITIQHANADSLIQLEGDKCNIITKNEITIAAAAKVDIMADEVAVQGKQTTKIGPEGNYYSAVNGEILVGLLSTLASMIDAKTPQTPSVASSLIESSKQSLLSKNVIISE